MVGESQGQCRDRSIRLYAELLPNIRQVTLYASLPPPANESDNRSITLSTDCRTVDSSDGAESVKLNLPARVSETSRERLKYNDRHAKGGELSFRLLVDEKSGLGQEEGESEGRPWEATSLGAKTRLRCRQCHNMILHFHSRDNSDPGVGKPSHDKEEPAEVTFKDLPSQNWAEMMDFWHCHKPDEHEHAPEHDQSHARNGDTSQDQNETVKGYGASNRVTAVPGTVLVDTSSFIIAEDDGLGLKKETWKNHDMGNEEESTSSSQKSSATPFNRDAKKWNIQTTRLLCRQCGVMLGVEDNEVANDGWRIYKANISVCPGSRNTVNGSPDEETWETYPVETIVAAQLLELIEREGLRRFVVHHSDSDEDGGVLLWVFNPDIRYSNSCSRTGVTNQDTLAPQRAMKVFYQDLSASKVQSLLANDLGERQQTSLGELDLHSKSILDDLRSSLKRSTEMLPVLARKFQEWDVGMMHRV